MSLPWKLIFCHSNSFHVITMVTFVGIMKTLFCMIVMVTCIVKATLSCHLLGHKFLHGDNTCVNFISTYMYVSNFMATSLMPSPWLKFTSVTCHVYIIITTVVKKIYHVIIIQVPLNVVWFSGSDHNYE